MSARKKSEAKPQRVGLGRRLWGSFVFLLILLGVLYGAAHLIVRTEGFASLAKDSLQSRLGAPYEVSRARLGWDLSLKLEGLQWVGEGPGRAGLAADEVVLMWGWPSGLRPTVSRLKVNGCRLSMARGRDGAVQPALPAPMIQRVAGWAAFPLPGGHTVSAGSVAEDQPSFAIHLTGGDLRWWDRSGVERAWATGVEFRYTPVSLPQRRLTHYLYRIGRARDPSGVETTGLSGEVLLVDGQALFLGSEQEQSSGK